MQFLNKTQKIAIYIYFFSINFEIITISGPGSYSLSKVTGILYLLTLMPQLKFFVRIDGLTKILFPIWLFFGLLTFNNLININELYSLPIFNQSLFFNILIFWFAINHVRKDYLLLERAIFSFALGSIFFTFLYVIGFGIEYDIDGRLSMFGDNANGIGVRVASALIILLLIIFQNRLQFGWYRISLLIPIPFMLKLMAETGSRKAAIAFALAFMTGIILMKATSLWNKILIILSGIVVFIFIGTIMMKQSEVLTDRLTNSAETGDLGGRESLWKSVIPLILEHPILGVGETGYQYYGIINVGSSKIGVAESPHNVILEVLCYTGFVGLSLYFFFLSQLFLRGYRSYIKRGLLLPLLLILPFLTILLAGQVLNGKFGWMILIYIMGSSAIKISPANQIEIIRDENSLFHR